MIRDVLKMGDARLLRVAEPVTEFDTPELHALVQDMLDTMKSLNGAGLAAPQIGVNQRVVIFGVETNPRYPDAKPVPYTVLINPIVEPMFKMGMAAEFMEEGWEGCLSVPGMRGVVERYFAVQYRGFDQFGKEFEREASGFHARVVQHECDHLDGVLYPMRIRDFTRFGFTDVLFPDGNAPADD